MRDKIIRYAEINPEDTIIEVGCGEGDLSEKLAEHAKQLHIIELDPQWISSTQERCKHHDNISYTQEDILKNRFEHITESSFRIIANIPYYLSAKFIKLIIEKRNKISSALIMVQDEFAKKLMAHPGEKDYTSLTVYNRFHCDTSYLFKVPKTCFRPEPKVDSAIIEITPKTSPPITINNEEFLFNIIRSAFWGRRKPLRSALLKSPYLNLTPHNLDIPELNPFSKVRGETLDLDDFALIANALENSLPGKNTK